MPQQVSTSHCGLVGTPRRLGRAQGTGRVPWGRGPAEVAEVAKGLGGAAGHGRGGGARGGAGGPPRACRLLVEGDGDLLG